MSNLIIRVSDHNTQDTQLIDVNTLCTRYRSDFMTLMTEWQETLILTALYWVDAIVDTVHTDVTVHLLDEQMNVLNTFADVDLHSRYNKK